MKTTLQNYFRISFLFMVFIACKKEFDIPPVTQASDGEKISIEQIKAKYITNISYKFRGDSNLYCVVTADEVSGNLYKDVYVRDAGGAIHVKLKYSGGLYIGDSIRINLKGVVLNEYQRLIQLDSVDVEKSVVKLASGLNPQPVLMTLEQINANTAASNSVQSKLVRINNVEFVSTDRNVSFADAEGKTAKNLILKSCSGQSITVRTSGYANFASHLTPSGGGYITAIVGQYGDQQGDMQLIIRQIGDVSLNGANCTVTAATTPTFVIGNPVVSVNENFSSQTATNVPVALAGWINADEKGTRTWFCDQNAGNYRAKATSYFSGETENVVWLITPPVIATASPTLSFKSAMAYPVSSHPHPLTIWISRSFNGKNLTSAGTWTAITTASIAPLTGNNFNWLNSGAVDLSTFLPAGYTGTYFIGFKYYGSGPGGYTTNYYLDDISIQ